MVIKISKNNLRKIARKFGKEGQKAVADGVMSAFFEGLQVVASEWRAELDKDWKKSRAGEWDVRATAPRKRGNTLVGSVIFVHDWAEVLSGGKSVPPRKPQDSEWLRIPISAKKGDSVNIPDRFVSDDGQYIFVKSVEGYKGENHLQKMRELGENTIENRINEFLGEVRDRLI